MSWNFTYSACQAPQGNQNPMNFFKYNPKFHVWSGDYVYGDSTAIYDFNGYTMNPTVYWNAADGAAPANAYTADYALLRFEKHYGRTGLAPYAAYWAESDKRRGTTAVPGFRNIFQSDDHDLKWNNCDWSVTNAQAGFPMPGADGGTGLDNTPYGQVRGIVDDAVSTAKQKICEMLDVYNAAFLLIKSQYANNPVSPGSNGNVPAALAGTVNPAKVKIEYFYEDFDGNGNLGGKVIRVIYPDCITYKSPQTDTDNAAKQFFGTIQEQWLIDKAIEAKTLGFGMVIFVSTKDLYNLDNNDGYWTYSVRRDFVLNALHTANVPHFWITGDKHVPHVGMARTNAGKTYDALAVCCCPFGQGTGSLSQYTENIWAASYNDQCVFGLVNVDDQAQRVNIYMIDSFDNMPVWSCSMKFGSRIPDRVWARPHNQFIPVLSSDRDTLTVTASPMTYQNTGNKMEQLNIVGGTTTSIEISEDNSTFDNIGATTNQINLRPGDYMKYTYSVAPTRVSRYRYET